MKKLLFLLAIIVLSSCGDKEDNPDIVVKNTGPVTPSAGSDFNLTLPYGPYQLIGGYFPNNAAGTSFIWSKTLGPELLDFYSFNERANISFLTPGDYQFRLKAWNSSGEKSDSVNVNVSWAPGCNAERIIGSGSFRLTGLKVDAIPYNTSITMGNGKIVIAGGADNEPFWPDDPPAVLSSGLVIIDPEKSKTSIFQLGTKRAGSSLSTAGDLIFIAGGYEDPMKSTDLVEVFDQKTNQIKRHKISTPRRGMSSANIGNLVLFAGGVTDGNGLSDVVDIYNVSTDTWTISRLSEARTGMTSVIANNKVYFAGGGSSTIDIYDPLTNSWSVAKLTERKEGLQCALYDGKIVFIGGKDMHGLISRSIEFFDPVTLAVKTDCLVTMCMENYKVGGISTMATAIDGRLYINDGGNLAYLDKATNKWTYIRGLGLGSSLFAINGILYAWVDEDYGAGSNSFHLATFME